MQTLCALGHLDFRLIGAHDYAQLFEMIDRLGVEMEAHTEVFRRMVFNVAAANCDDHTKNFSFLLGQGDTWQLSPAYDVTHAHNPKSRWTAQHLMAINGRTTEVGLTDVKKVGDRFAVPNVSTVVSEVLDAVDSWSEFSDQAQVGPVAKDEVGANIKAMSALLR